MNKKLIKSLNKKLRHKFYIKIGIGLVIFLCFFVVFIPVGSSKYNGRIIEPPYNKSLSFFNSLYFRAESQASSQNRKKTAYWCNVILANGLKVEAICDKNQPFGQGTELVSVVHTRKLLPWLSYYRVVTVVSDILKVDPW